MTSTQNTTIESDMFQKLVSSIKFEKINLLPILLPFIFLSSGILLLLSSGFLKSLLGGGIVENSIQSVQIDYSLSSYGALLIIGYLLSSTISVYYLVRKVSRHLHDSIVATTYFTKGLSVESLLSILESMVNKHSLPSPITSLLLNIVSSGITYPIILLLVEKAFIEHCILEEELLLKSKYSKQRTSVYIVLDAALIVLTLGAYGLYIAWRFTTSFNKHYELIHSTHPYPPEPRGTIQSTSTPSNTYSGSKYAYILLLLTPILSIIYTKLGSTIMPVIPAGSALIVSSILFSMRSENSWRKSGLALLLLYSIMIAGFTTGLLASSEVSSYTEIVRRELGSRIPSEDPVLQVVMIFTNNFIISILAVIPYIGLIPVAIGGYNAGVIMGYFTTIPESRTVALLTLVLPHTILEFTGYAILVVSSTLLFHDTKKFVKTVLTGASVLLLAAVVEVATIILL